MLAHHGTECRKEGDMTPLEVVRAYYALFEEPSRDQAERLVTGDFILDDNPIDWHIRGRAELWRTLDRPRPEPAAEAGNFEVRDYIGDDQRGAAFWHWRVTGRSAALFGLPPTDRAAEIDGVAAVEFREGQLARLTEYWDAASVMRQLGADVQQPRLPTVAG
jgi:steroid delta-isomerase-like uncharacterized protein